jgi:DNA primase
MVGRRAALACAGVVARGAEGGFTPGWCKSDRTTAVFVDYNQNARDRTIASAYSVRPTARATVSCPLTWEELSDADPDDLTMATVPGLLARRGDAMSGIDEVAYDLSPLLEWADRDDAAGLGDAPER